MIRSILRQANPENPNRKIRMAKPQPPETHRITLVVFKGCNQTTVRLHKYKPTAAQIIPDSSQSHGFLTAGLSRQVSLMDTGISPERIDGQPSFRKNPTIPPEQLSIFARSHHGYCCHANPSSPPLEIFQPPVPKWLQAPRTPSCGPSILSLQIGRSG